MSRIAAYRHEVDSLINFGEVLFVRPLKFPPHVPECKIDEIASVNMDGGGNWIAWSPLPATDEVTQKIYPQKSGFPCPYGDEGSLLWIQEAFAEPHNWTTDVDSELPLYKTSDYKTPIVGKVAWKSPIVMPREYSRLMVWVTGVSARRVSEISEEEARLTNVDASGVGERLNHLKYRAGLSSWWGDTYGKRGYDWNRFPYVWLVRALVASPTVY